MLRKATLAITLLLPGVLLSSAAVTGQEMLDGDTSESATSTFVAGQPIELRFSVRNLDPNKHNLQLTLTYSREHSERVGTQEIAVAPDQGGNWRGTTEALIDKNAPLGFYRVEAQLSDGTVMTGHGTREKGLLTFAVVPDPRQRKDYGQSASRVGLQGGFSTATNGIIPLLGIRWVCDSYDWKTFEQQYSGQFARSESEALAKRRPFPPRIVEATDARYAGLPWKVYTLPTLIRNSIPDWALDHATTGSDNHYSGALNAKGEASWPSYATAAVNAYARNYPELPSHLFQLTWEPAYPLLFGGTAAQLVKIYSLAYPAIHAADPKAVVIGPTLFPGTAADDKRNMAGPFTDNMKWMMSLWQAGLAKYIDGFSIHPYWKFPPERNGFIPALRAQVDEARTQSRRKLPFYSTEHGYLSHGLGDELDQARGDIRQTLIILGEGARFDINFYSADYFDEKSGGFGFYYNLDPKLKFGTDKISPKPAAPALAALTLILDGSESKGPLTGLGPNSLGYRFERSGKTISALWNYGDTPQSETLTIPASQVTVFDWMGNAHTERLTNELLHLTLSPEPTYIEY